MAEKNPAPQETVRPPAGPPSANEGRPPAARSTTWILVVGGVLAGLGLVFAETWAFWSGLAVGVLALLVGRVRQTAGPGQPTGTGRVR